MLSGGPGCEGHEWAASMDCGDGVDVAAGSGFWGRGRPESGHGRETRNKKDYVSGIHGKLDVLPVHSYFLFLI